MQVSLLLVFTGVLRLHDAMRRNKTKRRIRMMTFQDLLSSAVIRSE